mgnify:FL=1
MSFVDDTNIILLTSRTIFKFNFRTKSLHDLNVNNSKCKDELYGRHFSYSKAENESIHNKFISFYDNRSYFLINKETLEIKNYNVPEDEEIQKLIVIDDDVYYYPTVEHNKFEIKIKMNQ